MKAKPSNKPVEPVTAVLDEKGHEVVDSTPMQPPLGFQRQPSVNDRIRQMIRSYQLEQEALQSGMETEDEANDFVTDEDEELKSGYEIGEDGQAPEFIPPPAEPARTPPEGGAPAVVEPAPAAAPAPAPKQ